MGERSVKVVILAAGIGSRLGKPYPKPLTELANGKSILQNQIDSLLKFINIDDIYVVVGFKKELIMEAFPDLLYIYNNYYDSTNTSKSLLRALKKVRNHDVIWMNGDVAFESSVINRVIKCPFNSMAVNTSKVGDEEVKYRIDEKGRITNVSKLVDYPNGEAVGINKIIQSAVNALINKLEVCDDFDYFEKAIELAIQEGLEVFPINVSDLFCKEIDFVEDLESVNDILGRL